MIAQHFFNGMSPRQFLELITTDQINHPILENLELMNVDGNTFVVPYTRYHLPVGVLNGCVRGTPIVLNEERMYGQLELGEAEDLTISLPQCLSLYVFAKICILVLFMRT